MKIEQQKQVRCPQCGLTIMIRHYGKMDEIWWTDHNCSSESHCCEDVEHGWNDEQRAI